MINGIKAYVTNGPGGVIASAARAVGNVAGEVPALIGTLATLGTVRSVRWSLDGRANNVGEYTADLFHSLLKTFNPYATKGHNYRFEMVTAADAFGQAYIKELRSFGENLVPKRNWCGKQVGVRAMVTRNHNLFMYHVTTRATVLAQAPLQIISRLFSVASGTFTIPAAVLMLGTNHALNTLACASLRDLVNLITFVVPSIFVRFLAPTPSYKTFSPKAIGNYVVVTPLKSTRDGVYATGRGIRDGFYATGRGIRATPATLWSYVPSIRSKKAEGVDLKRPAPKDDAPKGETPEA